MARDLAWLKREILRVLESENDPEAVDLVAEWAEAGLQDTFDQARAGWMQRVATATVADGVIILPPSYLGMVAIFPTGGGLPLDPCTTEQAATIFLHCGPSTHYLIEGYTMSLVPAPAEGSTWRFTYWSKGDPLIEDTDTNALLANNPMAAVYGGARHGDVYAGADPSSSRHEEAFQKQLAQMNRGAKSFRLGTGYQVRRG